MSLTNDANQRQAVVQFKVDPAAPAFVPLYQVYLFALAYWGVVTNHTEDGSLFVRSVAGLSTPQFVALQIAYGPILLALVLCKVLVFCCILKSSCTSSLLWHPCHSSRPAFA